MIATRDIANILNGVGVLSSVYANTNLSLPKEMHITQWRDYIRKYMFLTHIGLAFTSLTLALTVCLTLANKKYSNGYLKKLHSLREALLILTFPLEGLILSLFWPLFFLNPSLVVDNSLYGRGVKVSLLTNLCMHLFPFFFLLPEFMHGKVKDRRRHYFYFFTFTFVYVLILHLHNYCYGVWPYGVIKAVGMYRYALFSGCFLGLCGYYKFFMTFNKRVNGRR